MKVNLQSLGRSVKRLQSQHHRMLDARLVEIGSTLAQWDALRAIGANPGASSHDLAEYTFQTDQSFGALAERLAAKGLVTRAPGRGRALRHGLTAQGKRLLAQASKAVDRVFAESFAPLTEAERVQFLSLIARLLRAGQEERSL
jgi:DNA-binding MarR family transcriptional regulator